MAVVFGKGLTKREILQYVGSIESIAGVRRIEHHSGTATGLHTFEVTCGRIRFNVLIDRCLDIGEFYFDGMPLHFLSRTGMTSSLRSNDGPNAIQSMMGGLMFTCGLQHIGGAITEPNGRMQPHHGKIRNTPAIYEGANCYWDGDEYYIEIKGQTRGSALFGPNLVLRRTIRAKLGECSIQVDDEIENEGFAPSDLKLLYHCNLGYPMLDENAYMVIDPSDTVPRDQCSATCMEERDPTLCDAPTDNFPEQVYYHHLKAMNGRHVAKLINPNKNLEFVIDFDAQELTGLIHWKSVGSGDYALGMEPTNSLPKGLGCPRGVGDSRTIQPGECIKTSLKFTVRSFKLQGKETHGYELSLRH